MKYLLATLLLFVSVCAGRAQIQSESSFPDLKDKKGDLIVVNEMHGALANVQVYLDILKHIRVQMPDDTINLFLEIPFSQAVRCNDFLASGGKTAMPKGSYPDDAFWNTIVAERIPVKIFGCDFEYDQQFKRNKSLLYLLEQTSDDLATNGQDVSFINSYAALVKDFKLKTSDTRGIKEQLKKIQTSMAPELSHKIDQLLFALDAPQEFSSGRDGFIYTRTLEGIAAGYFRYQNRINVLIHGVAHINPAYNKSLFNRLRNGSDSPFAGKCFLLGNIYLDCKNNSGIFQHELISSYSFYALSKDDSPVVSYFKTLQLAPHQVHFRQVPPPADLVFPDLKQEEILGLYVHCLMDN